ncbi:MAG: DNA polymerase III subunit beta [Candidatus Competibacteraceae bacterium]|nr:DNA polymerase III subunit beta [Candidatus Competibacteraceae bacterium]
MNFAITSKTLLQQLQVIGGIISNNSTVPILNDFLFEAGEDGLTIYGSDLESSFSARVGSDQVNVKKDGSIAIPAKLLLDTMKTFADMPLVFTVDAKTNGIVISSETGKYKLSGHNPADFPRMPEIATENKMAVDSMTLAHAINKTIFATGNDDIRPVMSGVLFEMSPTGCNFVATDAHKLVRYHRKDVTSSGNGSIVLPKKPLNLLKNILLSYDTPVDVSYNDTNVSFSFENYRVVSRLIDGKFPNYEAVFPKNNPNRLMVDKTPLLNAIRRVSIFSNKTTYQVRLKIAGSDLQIMAEDLDFANEAFERLTCQYDGDDLEIGFNSRFLIEMIQNIDSENVVFELSEPNRAGIVKPGTFDAEVEDITMLVMPIMLNH